jgi:hypothetical protein
MTTTTTVTTLTTTTVVESKPLASKQNAQVTNGASVVIPKKRPSDAVAPSTKRGSENVAPRRTLKQSTSTSSLAQKGMTRSTSRRRAAEPADPEVPRKKQKVEPVQDWDDLDAADANDPFMVSEYVNEIFDYMRVLEVFHPFCRRKSSLVQDQNNAESRLHETPNSLAMAHERDPRRLAH